MGSGYLTAADWHGYSTRKIIGKRTEEIYSASHMNDALDPSKIKIRESRDSADHPSSTPIIIGLDVTGSMSPVLDHVAREGLKELITGIYDRKPITDPHVMCMGIGDVAAGDEAPLQVTQFEADIRVMEQSNQIWLEQGGGGNSYESYILPWYFAVHKTSIDSLVKRDKKGYLITIGDEGPTPNLTASQLERVFGVGQHKTITAKDLLEEVSKSYHVFHFMIEQGSFFHGNTKSVTKQWVDLLGQRARLLSDYSKLAQVIISTIQLSEGLDMDTILQSWDKETSDVVSHSVINFRS